MTKQEENDFKKLIVEALGSREGQEVIKSGALAALKSDEGQDILTKSFVDGFHEIIAPVFDEHSNRIKKLEEQRGAQL